MLSALSITITLSFNRRALLMIRCTILIENLLISNKATLLETFVILEFFSVLGMMGPRLALGLAYDVGKIPMLLLLLVVSSSSVPFESLLSVQLHSLHYARTFIFLLLWSNALLMKKRLDGSVACMGYSSLYLFKCSLR